MCHDMGTERKIPRMKDFLPHFFHYIDPAFDADSVPVQDRLFPFALQSRGWRHLWDNELHHALKTLSFFPRWLAVFKSLCSFLRHKSVIETMVKQFRSTQRPVLAQLLEKHSTTNVAEWRWGTLASAMRSVEEVLDTMIENFDVHVVSIIC